MKCQYCGQPATIHMTDIVNKQKRETHMCEQCARERELMDEEPNAHLDLPALVALLMNHPKLVSEKSAGLNCPECGLDYTEFRAEGRFGCANDYDAFRPVLLPLLERIHRSLQHCGKVPRQHPTHPDMMALETLRNELAKAVADERYEEAARIRDLIRQKETADGTR